MTSVLLLSSKERNWGSAQAACLQSQSWTRLTEDRNPQSCLQHKANRIMSTLPGMELRGSQAKIPGGSKATRITSASLSAEVGFGTNYVSTCARSWPEHGSIVQSYAYRDMCPRTFCLWEKQYGQVSLNDFFFFFGRGGGEWQTTYIMVVLSDYNETEKFLLPSDIVPVITYTSDIVAAWGGNVAVQCIPRAFVAMLVWTNPLRRQPNKTTALTPMCST